MTISLEGWCSNPTELKMFIFITVFNIALINLTYKKINIATLGL